MISEALILPALDTLVLERAKGAAFVPAGDLPAWCEELAPDAIHAGTPFDVTEVFPFFDLFLPDAEATWTKGTPRRLDSDGFTQILANGTEIHLVGTALRVDGRSLLLVTVNERLFQEERNVLQRARELRFTHDALAREIEQKEVLTHCVVHDLRNPLTAILAALALLEQRPLDSGETKLVEVATRAAKRQDELIRDVLSTFAATHDTGSSTSVATPWSDIGSIVSQVASVLEPTARSRGVTIETDLDVTTRAINGHRTPTGAIVHSDGTIEVAADELRLFRVLGNLVENALRYSPVGGTILIRVDAEGKDIFVAVEDEGPGVPPELVPHLFKKFARGGGDGHPGTGLGLYFCRITVEGWGGRLGYEPRDTGGSRFWFRLPKRR